MSKNYILDPSETIHFHHEGELLFEELLTAGQMEKLLEAIEVAGGVRDLFLRNEKLLEFYKGRLWRSILSGLFAKRKIRIAFDTILPPEEGTEAPLAELTCIQGIEGGAVVDLSNGNVQIFAANKAIPEMGSKRLLIGFGHEKSIYRLNENDPGTHGLKDYGYGFGDVLEQKTHPLLNA